MKLQKIKLKSDLEEMRDRGTRHNKVKLDYYKLVFKNFENIKNLGVRN